MNQNTKTSFISLTRKTFCLLSATQRAGVARSVAIAVMLALLEVISLAVAIPMFYKLVTSGDQNILLTASGLSIQLSWVVVIVGIIILFVLKNILVIGLTHQQHQFANALYIHFAERLYRQFFTQSYPEYLQQNTGESFRKIKDIAFEFTNNVLLNYLAIIADFLICIFVVGMLLWYDYRIILILFILSVPVCIFYVYFRKSVIAGLDQSFRKHTPDATVKLMQGIDSFAEAQVYHKEKFFIRRFIDISRITTGLLSRLKVLSGVPVRLFETVGIICFSAVVVYQRSVGESSGEMLIFFALLSIVLYRVVPSLNRIFTSLSQIQAYAYTVSQLYTQFQGKEEQIVKTQNAGVNFQHEISLVDVSFSYPGSNNFLLKNISIQIGKGEFIVLEGASGSGKTTLLNILSGLIINYSGRIYIDNALLSNGMMKSWQNTIGFVMQTPVILQDTLLHNIAFGEEPSVIDNERVREAARLASLHNFISTLSHGYNTGIGENGMTLSGGQRQRLALARALYRDPDVLLLDEVTNQLDETTKLEILHTLQSLCRNGKTIILASHELITQRFADRVFHVRSGQILEREDVNI